MMILLIAITLGGCSMLQRHPGSGYSSFNTESPLLVGTNEYQDLMGNEENVGDVYNLSPSQRQRLNLRLALHQAEKDVMSIEERRLYYRYKDLMASDDERLRFLKLPTLTAKENYLQRAGYYIDDSQYSREIASLIAENDISLGMPMKAVRESWGEPKAEEISGHQALGNARWRYTKYIKSIEGYKREDRTVFFQGGLVVGWDTK